MITVDAILFFGLFAMCVGLIVVAKLSETILNTKWKLCFLVPLVFVAVMLCIGGFELLMAPAYIAGVICLGGFFVEKSSVRRIVAVIAIALVFLTTITTDENLSYREADYVGDFEIAFDTLKAHYALAEHKKIDWDALYETYHAKFEEVKEQHDPVLNTIIWKQFCAEFHDDHVRYGCGEDAEKEAMIRMAGNDYGLSLMTLANGDVVAVNVAEKSEAFRAGIHNGTVITAWNGEDVDALFAKADMSILGGFPVKENEDFYRGIVAAGIGEDSVSITFVDDQGKSRDVDATKMGDYYDRMKSTLDIVDQGVEASNLSIVEQSQDTYVLRIKNMMYDEASYEGTDYSEMEGNLRDQLNQLKEQGVKHLIIDIRGNGGGSPHMIMAIAKLLAPVGEYTYSYEGVFNKKTASYEKNGDGTYKVGEGLSFVGENLWDNRKVTILANAQSVSAADHFIFLMKNLNLPNVDIVGFTTTNHSGQAITGIQLSSGILSYSVIPTLNEKGEIFVDTDATRQLKDSNVSIIPFDQDAVTALFDQGEDYLLKVVTEFDDWDDE